MHDKLAKIMAKKKDAKKLSSGELEAKLNAANEMHKWASEEMGNGLEKKLKKVTVASDSEEGLEEGLEKAKEIVEEKPDMMDAEKSEEDAVHEAGESVEDEMMEHSEDGMEEMSEEEIDEKLQKLMALKAKLAKDKE